PGIRSPPRRRPRDDAGTSDIETEKIRLSVPPARTSQHARCRNNAPPSWHKHGKGTVPRTQATIAGRTATTRRRLRPANSAGSRRISIPALPFEYHMLPPREDAAKKFQLAFRGRVPVEP